MVTIYYSSKFKKTVKKYSSHQKQIVHKINIFIQNPFDPQLKTHKLSGNLQGYWSFSITYHIRIMFEFIDEETIGFIDIGTHQIYRI